MTNYLRVGGALILALAAFAALPVAVNAGDAAPPATPAGAVTGRVLDAKGNPVKGAHVVVIDAQALASSKGDGRDGAAKSKKAPAPVASGETDKDGVYKIDNVPAGHMRIAARIEESTDHSFTFAPKPQYDVAAGRITKVDDIKFKAPGATGAKAK